MSTSVVASTNPLSRWQKTNPNFINNNNNTNTRSKKYGLKNNPRPMAISSSYSAPKERSLEELEKEIPPPLSPPLTAPTFDFKSYMQEKLNSVNKALDRAIPLKKPVEIFKPMRYTISGGKMLRPMLLIATCELVGGQEQTAMPFACAVEMINSMTTIQDDLIDGDEIRRGKPACHKVFGHASTITGGDALISHAFHHMVSQTKGLVPSDRVVRIVEELARASGPEGVMGGQLLDTVLGPMTEADMEDLEYFHKLKNVLLIEAPVVIGAILGGADDEQVERFREFGRIVGKIFGIGDDFLDVEADALVDKPTYPKVIGLERTRELLQRLRSEAQEMLSGFGYDEDEVAPLRALVDFIAYRDH